MGVQALDQRQEVLRYRDVTKEKPGYRIKPVLTVFQLRIRKKSDALNLIKLGCANISFRNNFTEDLTAQPYDTLLNPSAIQTTLHYILSYSIRTYNNAYSNSPAEGNTFSERIVLNKFDTLKYSIEYD